MRDAIYRYMPLVYGLLLGWLLLAPPAWLDGLGPFRWVVNAALVALLLLSAVPLLILANLPENLTVHPMRQGEFPNDLLPLRERFVRMGFLPVGPPMRLKMAPAAIVLGFVHESEPIYGTVFRTTTVPAKTSYDFVSILEGGNGGLTTNGDPAGASIPTGASGFRQVLAGRGPEDLLRAHREGLAYLHERGIRIRAVYAEGYRRDLAAALRFQREHFLSAPFRSSLLTFWRAATKRVPFLGLLRDQAVAHRQIERYLAGHTGGIF